MVYLVLGKEKEWLPEDSHNQPIFNAAQVHLRVLAPKDYYVKYDLSWLEEKINQALLNLIGELRLDHSLKMDIKSNWSTHLESWDKGILDEPLSILSDWKPAYPA